MCFVSVYCVFRKKAQLKKKRGVPQINEQMLFHGTSSEFVEAICIHNFDWRINGIHGALFGKGNYQNPVGALEENLLSWERIDCLYLRGLRVTKLKVTVLGSWHTLRVSETPKNHFLRVQDGRKTFYTSTRLDNPPSPSHSDGASCPD